MTIGTDEIGDRLRRVWPGVVAGVPVALSGGFWASMFRVPVTGQPTVWHRRSWSVMDFSPGAPLLAGLDGLAVLRRAPMLLRTLPAQLVAAAVTALHRLDPEPVTAAVQASATGVAWSAGDVLHQLRAGAEVAGRADVAAALDALATTQPSSGGEVVCHGDLHPFNVLEGDDDLVVLDWTGAVLTHPCLDLAR